jgi:hypothetical protein
MGELGIKIANFDADVGGPVEGVTIFWGLAFMIGATLGQPIVSPTPIQKI